MSKASPNPQPPEPGYAALIGERLLAEGFLLAFDAGTGRLAHANSAAVFQLELSEDALSDVAFEQVFDLSPEEAADTWSELVVGARGRWTGDLKATLSGTTTTVELVAALSGSDGGAEQVVIHARAVDTDGAPASQDGADAFIGMVEFDADGQVIASNDRAETALEYFGGDLVGKAMDVLWPRSETTKPAYAEFWEKLRQGRIVEGCFRHVTGEGNQHWLQSTYVPVRDTWGTLKSVRQYLMDVTDQMTAASKDAAFVAALTSAATIIRYDAEGYVTEATDAACEPLETNAADIVGKSINRLLDPEFQRGKVFKEAMARVAEGRSATLDIDHVGLNGGRARLRSVLVPMTDADGRTTGFAEVAVDITEELDRLQDLELRYEIIGNVMGVMDISATGEILAANKRYCIDSGVYENDLVGKDYKTLVPNDLLQSGMHGDLWEKVTAGKAVTGDFRRIRDGDGEMWRHSTYAPLRAQNEDRVRTIMCLSQNVTEEKTQLTDLEEKTRAIEAVVCTAEFAPDARIVAASPDFLAMLGYTLEEVRQKEHSMFCPPELLEGDGYATLWMRLRAGEMRRMEGRHITKDGRSVWLDLAYVPIKDHRGQVKRVMEFARDITAQSTEVHHLKQKMKAADTVFGMVEFDPSGTIRDFNDGFLRMIGYSSRGLADQHHAMLCTIEESTSQAYRDFWLALGRGEARSGHFHLRGHLGRDITVIGSYIPVKDRLGQVHSVVLFSLEVTEFDSFRDRSLKAAGTALGSLQDLLAAQASGQGEIDALSAALRDSCRTIEAGKAEIDGTVSEFKGIREAIKLIEETVGMVGEIATQTNLLAFNAAIEAARVGKNGEGFSIVADEVRRLAERNAAAARDITEQVRVISDRMASGAKGSEAATGTISDTGRTLGAVLDRLAGLAADATRQQDRMGEAARVVAQISEGT